MAQDDERDAFVGAPLRVRRAALSSSPSDNTGRLAVPDADTPLLPPDSHFVTLTHALTWIAFGVSMSNDTLHDILYLDRYGEHVPQATLKEAVACLVKLGSGGRIAMRGKYRSGGDHDENALLNEAIEPIRLTDFRQFSYLDDELRHGEGLLFWSNEDATILDYVIGHGRKDSYLQVTVDRAHLLREFRPHGPMGWEPEAIHWSDLEPPALARVKELARDAETDEWWNWPQAATWVDARDLEHIATMRLTAERWKVERGYDPAVALGAERYLGSAYCADPEGTEQDLQGAIERGAIRTLGRETFDSPSRELRPLDWRGGKIVYNRTATLVSASNMLSEWACDIAVNRADLWKEFPAVDRCEAGNGGGTVPANRQLDHDAIRQRATQLREENPQLKIGPAAASVVAELGHNPKTGKPWDQRGIERLIAGLWEGGRG